MFVAVLFYHSTVFQILKGDINKGHRDLFLFTMIENAAENGFHNPVFKGLDDTYLKVMKAAVGRLKMRFTLGGMDS